MHKYKIWISFGGSEGRPFIVSAPTASDALTMIEVNELRSKDDKITRIEVDEPEAREMPRDSVTGAFVHRSK